MPVDRHALIHGVFKAMDADDSGEVDAEEFMSIFSDKETKHAKRFLDEIDNIRSHEAAPSGGRAAVTAAGNAGDSSLSVKEFCEFMVEYTTAMKEKEFKAQIAKWHANLEGSARRLLLRRVFSKMDADKSGSISLEEFKALCSVSEGGGGGFGLRAGEGPEELFAHIEGDEGDGDGELSVDEWVPFVLEREKELSDEAFQAMVDEMLDCLDRKKRDTLLRQVFFKMDADGSGSVDRDEFEHLKDGGEGDDARLQMIYTYLDSEFGDSDGELSIDEWVQGMKAMGEEMDDEDFEEEVGRWMAALAKNQRKVWRGVFCSGNAHELVIAARAAGLTHALFVQNAHASADGEATVTDEWAPLADAISVLKEEKDAKKAEEQPATSADSSEWAPPAPPPAQVQLIRPASGDILRPLGELSPNVMKRASSAHPNSRMAPSKSVPALTPAAAAPAWAESAMEGAAGEEVSPVETKQAAAAVQEEEEVEQRLTHRGTAQCMISRDRWFRRFPVRDTMLTAPARRTRETALHMAGRLEEAGKLDEAEGGGNSGGNGGGNGSSGTEKKAAAGKEGATFLSEIAAESRRGGKAGAEAMPLHVCESLAPCDPSSLCDQLVKAKTRQLEVRDGRFATAPPLSMLLGAEGGEKAFGMYAESACDELAEALRGAEGFREGSKRDKTYLSVFSHAGYGHAIAHAVAAAAGMDACDLDAMIKFGLSEAEAVLIPLYGARGKPAIHLRRPR